MNELADSPLNARFFVRKYLESLYWDGEERICDIAKGRLEFFFISAVARALNPGCMVERSPLLVGSQGSGKSAFLRALGGDWYRDEPLALHDPDEIAAQVQNAWIYEVTEIPVRYAAELKALLTSCFDVSRETLRGGARLTSVPRAAVFAFTSNEVIWEGPVRRIETVRLDAPLDVEGVRQDRDQLWAEAVVLYRRGTPPRRRGFTNCFSGGNFGGAGAAA